MFWRFNLGGALDGFGVGKQTLPEAPLELSPARNWRYYFLYGNTHQKMYREYGGLVELIG